MRVKFWLQATVGSLALLHVVYSAEGWAAATSPEVAKGVVVTTPAPSSSEKSKSAKAARNAPVATTYGLIDAPAAPKVVKIEPSVPDIVPDVPLTSENLEAPRASHTKPIAATPAVKTPAPDQSPKEAPKPVANNTAVPTAAPVIHRDVNKAPQAIKADRTKTSDTAVAAPPAPATPPEITTNAPSASAATKNKTVAEQFTALMATSQPVPVTAPSSPSNLIPSGGEVHAATGPAAAAAMNKTPDAKEEDSFRVASSQAAVSPPPPVSSTTNAQVAASKAKSADVAPTQAPVDMSIIASASAEEKLKDLPLPPEKNHAIAETLAPTASATNATSSAAKKLKDLPEKIPTPIVEPLDIKTRDAAPSSAVTSSPVPTNNTSSVAEAKATVASAPAPVKTPPMQSSAQKIEAIEPSAQAASQSAAEVAKQTAKAVIAEAKKQEAAKAAPLQNALPSVNVKEDPASVAMSQRADNEAAGDNLSPATKAILDKLPSRLEKETKGKKSGPVSIQRERKSEALEAEKENKSGLGIEVKKRNSQVDMGYELELAYNALVAGNTEIAITKYQHVLQNEDDNQDALFGLATCYHRIGRLERARPLYGRLLAINPRHREALNNFLLMMSEEAPNEALQRLKEMQAANPDFAPISAQMSLVYEKLGDLRGAVDAMRDAITLEGDNLLYRYNLAILYDKMGAWEEAMYAYRYVLEAAERGQDLPGDVLDMKRRLDYITLKHNTQKSPDAKGYSNKDGNDGNS